MSGFLGSINLIIGCMFSGKTSELIKVVKRNRSIGKKVMVLNYYKDLRYGDQKIVTHDLVGVDSLMVPNFDCVLSGKYKQEFLESDIICINEGQFFNGLINFCQLCANNYNKHVYVCGLDGDYQQQRFGEILDLIPYSENVTRLSALCKYCGRNAYFTKRISESTQQVLISGEEDHIPVCRYHYNNETHVSNSFLGNIKKEIEKEQNNKVEQIYTF
jgi:thymidine kinase